VNCCTVGEVDFWIFWILNFLQVPVLNLDWPKNSKTIVEQAIFFIFMSSYAEMSFFGPNADVDLNLVKKKTFASTNLASPHLNC
jgi:hypothetical protein